tara:strand:- start:55 stop:213 length:159 start_codon:yes stop_codon:yes gene_type:complete
MGKKCTFVKLNEETGRKASMSRKKASKKSIEKTKSIQKDKLKRQAEWRKWWG